MLLHPRSVLIVAVLFCHCVVSANTLHASSVVSDGEKNNVRKKHRNNFPSSKHVANETPNRGKNSGSLPRARDLEDADPGFDLLAFALSIVGAIGRAVQAFLSFITFGLIPPPQGDPEPTDMPTPSPTNEQTRSPVVLTPNPPVSEPTRFPVVLTPNPSSQRDFLSFLRRSPPDCFAGEYEDGEICVPCPPNSGSTPGGTSIQDCKCNGGYVKEADGTCSPCPANAVEVNGVCEPCLQGLTSPAASAADGCSGCGDGVSDPGEDCDDGYRNGEPDLSDCTAACTITETPRGCCISPNECINDVLEPECPLGNFDAFGVCDPFSPVCAFDDVPAESLCGDNPEECGQDNNECVTAVCNTVTDECEYNLGDDFDPVSGGCVPAQEEGQCSTDSPPCPQGQIESRGSCSCQCCPSDQFESGGTCYECPAGTTSQAGSAGFSSCFEPEGDECPVETPPPSCPVATPSASPIDSPTTARKAARNRRLGICDDECTPLNSKQNIKLEGVQMKAFFSPVSPGTVADLVGAVEALGHLGNLANVANIAAGATQSASAALLEASKAFIDSNTSGNLASACIQGALKLGKLLMCRDGAAIWIKLSGECCLSTNCCIFWSNNEWVEKEYWHKCSAAPKHGIGGFRKGDAAKVRQALPGCIVEAVRAFKCP